MNFMVITRPHMFYQKPTRCQSFWKNCNVCLCIVVTDTVYGTDRQRYMIKRNINCPSVGVVYDILYMSDKRAMSCIRGCS